MPAGRGGLRRLSGKYRFKDRLWELNCGLLGLVLSIGAAFTITGMSAGVPATKATLTKS
jgi:diacylglycerol diphosphate phosphatase/phosphatidate phosphatase